MIGAVKESSNLRRRIDRVTATRMQSITRFLSRTADAERGIFTWLYFAAN